jgi:hypothetical protein
MMNFEVIAVDDGQAKILHRYRNRALHRLSIRVSTLSKQGIFEALNAGLLELFT